MRAIVWDGTAAAVRDGVEVRDLRAGEVRVEIQAAGLCHSDVSVLNGTIMFPPPVVLGHEGAGVVTQVAGDVTHLQVGDHVVLSTLGSCGHCGACDSGKPTFCRQSLGKLSRPFTCGDEKLFQFANLGVFANETVVKATQAVKIPTEVPFPQASLIGCGVLTGVGAVFNRAKVTHGETVVVIGVGGIGLNVIQGAALSDAGRIIAIDTNPAKDSIAREFGATDFICPSAEEDVIALVKAFDAGNQAEALAWHRKLFPLCRDMLGLATNPIPIKAAMRMLGRDTGELRMPMTPLDAASEAKLRTTLGRYGLL